MTIICAKLRINDSEFDILRMSYGFYRKTDRKGRPGTGLQGGNIYVLIESGTDNYLLRQMLFEEVPAVRGSIEVMTGQDELRMRYLEFESAYIFSQEEVMFGHSSYPMLTTIAISPVRFDIDRKVRLDRRWPETYGFWWQEYKPEERKYAGMQVDGEVIGAADNKPILTRVYLKNSEGIEIDEFPDNGIVTICAEVENGKPGDVVEFTLTNGKGMKKIVSGTEDSSGLAKIPDYRCDSL